VLYLAAGLAWLAAGWLTVHGNRARPKAFRRGSRRLGLLGVSLPAKAVARALLLVLAYMAPFAILRPYFTRYRYPIEPVIAVLVGVAVAYIAEAVCVRSSRESRLGAATR
jgi:hypothetical protein